MVIIPKLTSKKGKKYALISVAIISFFFLGYFLAFSPYSPFVSTGDVATPTTKSTSTIKLIDFATGEDVSDWVEISIWMPKDTDTDFSDDDDPYRLSKFDEDVDSDNADDVAEDLRSYAYVWLEIDPDNDSPYGGYDAVTGGMLTDDYRPLIGGANYDYTFYVYHAPENVTINVLNSGLEGGDDALGNSPAGSNGLDEWDGAASGNFTIVLDMDRTDASALHYGDSSDEDWDITDDDYADMDEDEINWLIDQRNFRTIAPMYDIADDLDKDYTDDLEKITNAFAIRFSFNDSISETDGAVNEVNITIVERDFDSETLEVVYGSNNTVFIIFIAPVTYAMGLDFDIEIELGSGINCSGDVLSASIPTYGVDVGRLQIPQDLSPLGSFTALDNAPLGFD